MSFCCLQQTQKGRKWELSINFEWNKHILQASLTFRKPFKHILAMEQLRFPSFQSTQNTWKQKTETFEQPPKRYGISIIHHYFSRIFLYFFMFFFWVDYPQRNPSRPENEIRTASMRFLWRGFWSITSRRKWRIRSWAERPAEFRAEGCREKYVGLESWRSKIF